MGYVEKSRDREKSILSALIKHTFRRSYHTFMFMICVYFLLTWFKHVGVFIQSNTFVCHSYYNILDLD